MVWFTKTSFYCLFRIEVIDRQSFLALLSLLFGLLVWFAFHVLGLHTNRTTEQKIRRTVKYWEIIADNLSKGGWSLGWVSALDLEGRTIWIVDAHGYGKGFVVRADEILTAFVELERAIHQFAVSFIV